MSFSTRLRRMINLNFELIEANDTKKAHMKVRFFLRYRLAFIYSYK